jgi:hypothetical protein
MATRYADMINTYFEVDEALDRLVASNENTYTEWCSNLVQVEFETESGEQTFSTEQLAYLLNLDEEQIQHFLVVDCCLNNQIYTLTGNREYESWETTNHELIITFPSGESQYYRVDDIAQLMKETASVGWSYKDLMNTWQELMLPE